jgi:hypothetical protein
MKRRQAQKAKILARIAEHEQKIAEESAEDCGRKRKNKAG